jgi:hypothetical protein
MSLVAAWAPFGRSLQLAGLSLDAGPRARLDRDPTTLAVDLGAEIS